MDSIMAHSNVPSERPPSHQPHKIGEWMVSELHEASGIWDGDQQLTNFEAIQLIEEGLGAQNVHITHNGHLSPEGKRHNSLLTRNSLTQGAVEYGAYVVSVLSLRPPTDDH